jgi:hypothetical protein
MSAHIPSVSWSLRAPEYGAHVRTESDDSLLLAIVDPSGRNQRIVSISRKDARLLAKRINQCLDDTSSKGKYGRRARRP